MNKSSEFAKSIRIISIVFVIMAIGFFVASCNQTQPRETHTRIDDSHFIEAENEGIEHYRKLIRYHQKYGYNFPRDPGLNSVTCGVIQEKTGRYCSAKVDVAGVCRSAGAREHLNFTAALYKRIAGQCPSLGEVAYYKILATGITKKLDTAFGFSSTFGERTITERELPKGSLHLVYRIEGEAYSIVKFLPASPLIVTRARPGDQIISINGVRPKRSEFANSVRYFRSTPGSQMVLVLRKKSGKTITVKVRSKHILESEKSVYHQFRGQTLYIRLYRFKYNLDSGIQRYNRSDAEQKTNWRQFTELVDQYMPDAKLIILDLRGNPGGYLEAIANIAGPFIGNNPILKVVNKHSNSLYVRSSFQKRYHVPIKIVMDGNTGSGAIAFASALKHFAGATIYGTPPSKGKSDKLYLQRKIVYRHNKSKLISAFTLPVGGMFPGHTSSFLLTQLRPDYCLHIRKGRYHIARYNAKTCVRKSLYISPEPQKAANYLIGLFGKGGKRGKKLMIKNATIF